MFWRFISKGGNPKTRRKSPQEIVEPNSMFASSVISKPNFSPSNADSRPSQFIIQPSPCSRYA